MLQPLSGVKFRHSAVYGQLARCATASNSCCCGPRPLADHSIWLSSSSSTRAPAARESLIDGDTGRM